MAEANTFPLYPAAVALPIVSGVATILDIPPLIWHLRNRNIGASSLVAWILALNVANFINAIIWPRDDKDHWWHGNILCDIEAKLFVGSSVAGAGAVACIMRSLARVMDTDNARLTPSRSQRQRQRVIELLLCFACPVFLMVAHYFVQDRRYYIFGISGCAASYDPSWVSIVLVFIWPAIFALIDAYYASLVIFRLRRYRSQMSHILQLSDTTKSRFMRLFVISLILILFFVPIQFYSFYLNVAIPHHPYSWSTIHKPETWNKIVLVPRYGEPLFDRWIWPVCGILVFAFFGVGSDAVKMYKDWLLAIGLGKVFPSLRESPTGRRSSLSHALLRSLGSRAKLLFSRKGSRVSAASGSFASESADTNLSKTSNSKQAFSLELSDMSQDDRRTSLRDDPAKSLYRPPVRLWNLMTLGRGQRQ